MVKPTFVPMNVILCSWMFVQHLIHHVGISFIDSLFLYVTSSLVTSFVDLISIMILNSKTQLPACKLVEAPFCPKIRFIEDEEECFAPLC